MKQYLIVALLLVSGSFSTIGRAYDVGLMPFHEVTTEDNHHYGRNISLHGSKVQVDKIRGWLQTIARVPKGMETLVAIQESGHKLFIYHYQPSMLSAGKTSAPVTSNLINGVGESVDIYFNFDMPNHGSHFVSNSKRRNISFTAVQNLFHELAHARHMMNGTWLYFDSEGQAIAEENEFRLQEATINQVAYEPRVFVRGTPICPDNAAKVNSAWGQDIICR